MPFRLTLVFVLFAVAFSSSCEVARASPTQSSRASARASALEAYDARKEGTQPLQPEVAEGAATKCAADHVLWRRMPDVEICTSACTSDAHCASGERCRVLHYDGIEYAPSDRAVYADEMPEVFEEHEEQRALLDDGLVLDDPPVCEGECSGAPGLPIRAVMPLAVCDPLFDVNE